MSPDPFYFLAPGFEMMLSNCATKNRQRQGFILEVQAARDIAASGLRIVSCNDAIKRNGKRTILDILATDSLGQQYNFEVKDWKKSSFSLEAVRIFWISWKDRKQLCQTPNIFSFTVEQRKTFPLM
jgi:hypothetical protein